MVGSTWLPCLRPKAKTFLLADSTPAKEPEGSNGHCIIDVRKLADRLPPHPHIAIDIDPQFAPLKTNWQAYAAPSLSPAAAFPQRQLPAHVSTIKPLELEPFCEITPADCNSYDFTSSFSSLFGHASGSILGNSATMREMGQQLAAAQVAAQQAQQLAANLQYHLHSAQGTATDKARRLQLLRAELVAVTSGGTTSSWDGIHHEVDLLQHEAQAAAQQVQTLHQGLAKACSNAAAAQHTVQLLQQRMAAQAQHEQHQILQQQRQRQRLLETQHSVRQAAGLQEQPTLGSELHSKKCEKDGLRAEKCDPASPNKRASPFAAATNKTTSAAAFEGGSWAAATDDTAPELLSDQASGHLMCNKSTPLVVEAADTAPVVPPAPATSPVARSPSSGGSSVAQRPVAFFVSNGPWDLGSTYKSKTPASTAGTAVRKSPVNNSSSTNGIKAGRSTGGTAAVKVQSGSVAAAPNSSAAAIAAPADTVNAPLAARFQQHKAAMAGKGPERPPAAAAEASSLAASAALAPVAARSAVAAKPSGSTGSSSARHVSSGVKSLSGVSSHKMGSAPKAPVSMGRPAASTAAAQFSLRVNTARNSIGPETHRYRPSNGDSSSGSDDSDTKPAARTVQRVTAASSRTAFSAAAAGKPTGEAGSKQAGPKGISSSNTLSKPLTAPKPRAANNNTKNRPASVLDAWAKPYKVTKADVEYAQQLARDMGWDRPAGKPRKPYDLVPYIADLQGQYEQVAADWKEYKKTKKMRGSA